MNTSEFTFMPITALADAIGAGLAETPEGMRPRLGALALLRWKPTRWGWAINASNEPTSGECVLKLMAGDIEIATTVVQLTGNEQHTGSMDVDLSQVLGDTPLRVVLDVDTAADAGITLTVHSRLEVHQPATAGGCLS